MWSCTATTRMRACPVWPTWPKCYPTMRHVLCSCRACAPLWACTTPTRHIFRYFAHICTYLHIFAHIQGTYLYRRRHLSSSIQSTALCTLHSTFKCTGTVRSKIIGQSKLKCFYLQVEFIYMYTCMAFWFFSIKAKKGQLNNSPCTVIY